MSKMKSELYKDIIFGGDDKIKIVTLAVHATERSKFTDIHFDQLSVNKYRKIIHITEDLDDNMEYIEHHMKNYEGDTIVIVDEVSYLKNHYQRLGELKRLYNINIHVIMSPEMFPVNIVVGDIKSSKWSDITEVSDKTILVEVKGYELFIAVKKNRQTRKYVNELQVIKLDNLNPEPAFDTIA